MSGDLKASLTIVTATSVLPAHPSTHILESAVDSLGRFGGLTGCRHLVVCDGCSGADMTQAARYAEYKQRLRSLVAAGRFCTRMELIELPSAAGLPGVILEGCARVRTPYVLVYEHDWELARRVDSHGIVRTLMQYRDVHHVRLNKREICESGWDFVLKPDRRRRQVPLVRTSSWSANPHFSRMSYYRRLILPRLCARVQGGSAGFDEPLCKSLHQEIRYCGFDRAQRRWGVFIYGHLGDPPIVLHLDGRRQSSQSCVAITAPTI